MRKITIVNFVIILSLFTLIVNLDNPSNVSAVTSSFTENFTSTVYRDVANSDVQDWGSGHIRLPFQTPSIIGSYSTTHESLDVEIVGNLAFVPDGINGLKILNISNPSLPVFVGNYTPTVTASAEDVCVSGDYAFIGYKWDGFHIANISDPANPTNVYTYDPGDAWGQVEVSGNYAYVLSNLGLYTFDISNMGSITIGDFIGYPPTGLPNGLAIDGNYAYVASGNVVLWVIDILDPTDLLEVGTFGPSEYGRNVCVAGDYAYVSCGIYGVNIFNISNPLAPFVVGGYDEYSSEEFQDAFVQGRYLYGAAGADGLIILDVDDPTSPTRKTDCNTGGYAEAIFTNGIYAFIADGPGGLRILDVSKINRFETTATAQSTAIFTGDESSTILEAMITVSKTELVDTSIDIYLSADNGVNWESVSQMVIHEFINTGYRLKWKAVFTTTNIDITPILNSISVSYTCKLPAVSLLNPYNGIVTIDDTPLFEWDEITDLGSYLIQIDDNNDFLTPVINETVSETSYEVTSALDPKTYYWRVAGIDTGGDTGFFSETRTIVIQAIVPEFNVVSFSLFALITLSIVVTVFLKKKK